MYTRGLYVEPDPDAVYAELPQFGEPTVAARRRRREQGMEFITSLTGDLDAWYLYQHGYRKTPAPKPTIGSHSDLLALVDRIAAAGAPGWLAIGTTLLEPSTKVQHQWAAQGRELAQATAKDGRGHSFTAIGGTRRDNNFVLAWFTRTPTTDAAVEDVRLSEYLSAKKHQIQAARGMGLVFGAGSSGLSRTLYDNRRPGPDTILDAAGTALRPVNRSQRSKPPPPARKPKGGKRQAGGRRKK